MQDLLVLMRNKDDFPRNKDDVMRNKDDFIKNKHDFLGNKDDFLRNKHDFLRNKHDFLRNKDDFLRNKDHFVNEHYYDRCDFVIRHQAGDSYSVTLMVMLTLIPTPTVTLVVRDIIANANDGLIAMLGPDTIS